MNPACRSLNALFLRSKAYGPARSGNQNYPAREARDLRQILPMKQRSLNVCGVRYTSNLSKIQTLLAARPLYPTALYQPAFAYTGSIARID